MWVSPNLSIDNVLVAQIGKHAMNIDLTITSENLGQKRSVKTTALLDTGAGGKIIDQNYVRNQKIETKELEFPIKVFNVDRTPNKRGTIMKYARLNLTINR